MEEPIRELNLKLSFGCFSHVSVNGAEVRERIIAKTSLSSLISEVDSKIVTDVCFFFGVKL